MGPFVLKDISLVLRDRKELTLLILMPFLLIVILGFALGGWFETEHEGLEMSVVLVIEDEENEGLKRFFADMNEVVSNEATRKKLYEAAQRLRPRSLLLNMLTDEEMSRWLTTVEGDREYARDALNRNEVAAALIVPAGFTYDTLRKTLLDEGDGAILLLEMSESSPLKAGVFQDIIDGFVDSFHFYTALGYVLDGMDSKAMGDGFSLEPPSVHGGFEPVPGKKPLTSLQYYTIGMAVMFVLFIASSVSSHALLEQLNQVYNRINLAGRSPLYYLAGKAISASLLAFMQLLVLFGLSALALRTFAGLTFTAWGGMLAISAALAICIGMLSIFITSLSFFVRSTTVADVFAMIMVTALALFGGSFVPAAAMPEWISAIGGWTPNGAALSSYLLVMQGGEWSEWFGYTGRLLLLSVALLGASAIVTTFFRKAG